MMLIIIYMDHDAEFTIIAFSRLKCNKKFIKNFYKWRPNFNEYTQIEIKIFLQSTKIHIFNILTHMI